MSREEKARIDCLVEDRGTLVDAIAFLFNEEHRKISRMDTVRLIKKLENAYLSCDEILDDLIEDGFDIVSLPNDYGELLMIYYGAALRFSARKVNVKKEKKVATKGRKASGIGAYVKNLVTQANYTWDEICSMALEQFPSKESTLRTYYTDFRSLKYHPKEGIMVTSEDNIVRWKKEGAIMCPRCGADQDVCIINNNNEIYGVADCECTECGYLWYDKTPQQHEQ
jgi:hypothetical protein